MILNSYGPFWSPYTSPEWIVDIEIQSNHLSILVVYLQIFHIQINLSSKRFNENGPTYSNLIVILMINLRLNVITNTQVLYFYFEKHLSLYWTYYKLAQCSFFVKCHYCGHQGRKFEFFILKFVGKRILRTETVKIHVSITLSIENLVSKMFGEDKRLQKSGHTFLRMAMFVMYFRKYVKYFLTFMDRQLLALVGENFYGLFFTFIPKFLMLKLNFSCNFQSLLYLRKTICWRDIFHKMNFFR